MPSAEIMPCGKIKSFHKAVILIQAIFYLSNTKDRIKEGEGGVGEGRINSKREMY